MNATQGQDDHNLNTGSECCIKGKVHPEMEIQLLTTKPHAGRQSR